MGLPRVTSLIHFMQGTLHKGEMYSLSKKIYLDPSLISSPVGSIVDGGNVLLGGNTISGRAQPNQQQEKPKKKDAEVREPLKYYLADFFC